MAIVDSRKLIKFVVVLLIAFAVLVTNLDGGLLALLGASGSVTTAAGLSLAVALLVLEGKASLVVLVLLLCVLVNMPADFVTDLGISRELILATLVGVVLTPFVARAFR